MSRPDDFTAKPTPEEDPGGLETVDDGAGTDAGDLDYAKTQVGLDAGRRVFGRYLLKRIAGRGGMGLVWQARDEKLRRNVALKFLPQEVALDERSVDDLKRETNRALDLTHPNIVRIYDFLEDDLTAAIAMELVEGPSLSKLALKRPDRIFGIDELKPWIRQLGEALDYAHQRARVVHRDLKPANLMIDARGDLKITDFGISATLTDATTRVSRSQSVSGTPVYMSPQQMMGDPPSERDDIYALGATLYELLTGKPPFYSGRIEMQVLNKVPPTMAQRRAELMVAGAEIPAVWETVVAACLDKLPESRPASGGEVVRQLLASSPAAEPEPAAGIEIEPAPLPTQLQVLSSPEGAGVSLAGENCGTTPATLADLPAAERLAIRVELTGFRPWVGEVELAMGETRSLDVGELIPLTGSITPRLTVKGEPLDDLPEGFLLDGEPVIVRDGLIAGIAPGPHELSLAHDDYEEVWSEVTVVADETAEWSADLGFKPAHLNLTVSAEGRESIDDFSVWVNGEPAGSLRELAVPAHEKVRLEVRAPEYSPDIREVELSPGERRDLKVQFRKPSVDSGSAGDVWGQSLFEPFPNLVPITGEENAPFWQRVAAGYADPAEPDPAEPPESSKPEPAAAWLQLNVSGPAVFEVLIDGERFRDARRFKLPPDVAHRIKVRARGYQTVVREWILAPEADETWEVALEKTSPIALDYPTEGLWRGKSERRRPAWMPSVFDRWMWGGFLVLIVPGFAALGAAEVSSSEQELSLLGVSGLVSFIAGYRARAWWAACLLGALVNSLSIGIWFFFHSGTRSVMETLFGFMALLGGCGLAGGLAKLAVRFWTRRQGQENQSVAEPLTLGQRGAWLALAIFVVTTPTLLDQLHIERQAAQQAMVRAEGAAARQRTERALAEAASRERQIQATIQANQIVRDVYRSVLDRDPDPEGLANYTTRIVEQRWSTDRIRRELLNSPECGRAVGFMCRATSLPSGGR